MMNGGEPTTEDDIRSWFVTSEWLRKEGRARAAVLETRRLELLHPWRSLDSSVRAAHVTPQVDMRATPACVAIVTFSFNEADDLVKLEFPLDELLEPDEAKALMMLEARIAPDIARAAEMRAKYAKQTEAKERADLARLKAKYEGEGGTA